MILRSAKVMTERAINMQAYLKRVMIRVKKMIDADLSLPQSFLEREHLSTKNNSKKKLITGKCGQVKHKMKVLFNRTDNEVYVTPTSQHRLGLIDNMSCNLSFDQSTARFGPVVGVLVEKHSIYTIRKQGEANFRIGELLSANEEAGNIIFFFSLEHVSMRMKRILGTYYDFCFKRWQTRLFPIPDALYDRGSGATVYHRKQVILRKMLATFDVDKVNAVHYFNKYDLYHKLVRDEAMKSHLPFTVLYRDSTDLNKFENEQPFYIKKCIGSNGLDVVRVGKLHGGDGYEYRYFAKRMIVGKVYTRQELLSKTNAFFGAEPIILQQAIPLLQVGQRLMDMRATLQRDGRGNLQITAITARVGHKHSPVTSTRTGSTCLPIEQFYKKYMRSTPSDVQELRDKMETFLVKTYGCIENAYGPFGEMGIDFAMDQQGKLWFIECNAKPAKDSLYQAHDRATIRKAFLYPLQYAQFISGFEQQPFSSDNNVHTL